jgi:hypothetical protein
MAFSGPHTSFPQDKKWNTDKGKLGISPLFKDSGRSVISGGSDALILGENIHLPFLQGVVGTLP